MAPLRPVSAEEIESLAIGAWIHRKGRSLLLPSVIALADHEGFPAHAAALRQRLA